MTSTVLPFWYTLKSETKISNLYVPPAVNPTPTPTVVDGTVGVLPSAQPTPNSTPTPTSSGTTSIPAPIPTPTAPTLDPDCTSVSNVNQSLNLIDPVSQLHDYGYTVLPTITDGTAYDSASGKNKSLTLSTLLSKPASEKNIVNAITQLVLSKNYDGIDLDFEDFAFIDPNTTWKATSPRWIAFIKDLSAALHAKSKLLSVTTPPLFDPATGKKGYYVYAWPDIGSYIDQLHIMAYDYSTSSVGPIGPITWTEQAVQYAVASMPASKVYIGAPGYGRDWVVKVDGVCPTAPINYQKSVAVGAKAATFLQKDALSLASTYGATPSFNAKYGESSFTYQKSYAGTVATGGQTSCTATRTAWYQDAQSIALRASLVSKYRLAGLTEWTLGMEDNSVLNAVMSVAKSIAPDPVVAALTETPTAALKYGDTVTVTSSLTKKDGSPLAGINSTIQFKIGDGQWQSLVAGATDVHGQLTGALQLNSSVTLRFISDGSWNISAGQSDDLTLTPTRIIHWRAPASMKAGVTYAVTGDLSPAATGVTVRLLRTSNHDARGNLLVPGAASSPAEVAKTKTDSSGHFTFSLTERFSSTVRYQVIIDGDSTFATSQSDSFGTLIR